jgi:hypothetical protein
MPAPAEDEEDMESIGKGGDSCKSPRPLVFDLGMSNVDLDEDVAEVGICLGFGVFSWD